MVDAADFDAINRWNWCLWVDRNGRKYAVRVVKANGVSTTIFLHRYLLHALKGEEVDHENGDGLDNRRTNLRIASSTQNNRNRRKRVGVSSVYKGVSRHYTKWAAAIWSDGGKRWLGRFDTEEEAARAYDVEARKMYGAFARLNFPCADEQAVVTCRPTQKE